MRDLAGRIERVRIIERSDNHTPKYFLQIDIVLTQMPRQTTIRGVKFFGPLSIPHPDRPGERLTANSGNYDALINALLQSTNLQGGDSMAKAEQYLTQHLQNLPVMLQTIGGVWVLTQL
jgi:hypothetical protein